MRTSSWTVSAPSSLCPPPLVPTSPRSLQIAPGLARSSRCYSDLNAATALFQAARPGFFRQNSARSFKLLDLRRSNQSPHSTSSGGLSSPAQLSPPSTPAGLGHPPWPPGYPSSRTSCRIPTVCSRVPVFKIVNGIRSSRSPPVSFCQVVLRINSIFEARVGKKHLRRIYHYAETSSGRGDAGKTREQRRHRVSKRSLLPHIFRLQSQTRTATPRAKLKRDQRVSQRIPPILLFPCCHNHPTVPVLSPPPAPGVSPVHPEQAWQSPGVPLQPLAGAGAPPAAAFRVLPGGVAAETEGRRPLPASGHPAVPAEGEGHNTSGPKSQISTGLTRFCLAAAGAALQVHEGDGGPAEDHPPVLLPRCDRLGTSGELPEVST